MSVGARFLAGAADHAGRVAIRGSDGSETTYGDLRDRAGAIAAAIHERASSDREPWRPGGLAGALGPAPVSILVERRAEPEALLGALLAGRPFAVLDAAASDAETRATLAALGSVALLASPGEAARARSLAEGGALPTRPAVIDLGQVPARVATAVLAAPCDLDAPASIVFTSGSTGNPAGVVRSHGALLRRAEQAASVSGLVREERVSRLHSCRHVAAEGDLLGALLLGAAVCEYDPRALGYAPLADWLAREGVTRFHPPVPVLRRLLRWLDGTLRAPALRVVALGGEGLFPSDIALCARSLREGCEIEHRLSASEVGMIARGLLDPRRPRRRADVPSGRPVPGVRVLLLDAGGRPVPDGETGELFVEGRHLALGYLGDPARTGARFGPGTTPGERRYRTGDLARLLPDGQLLHGGRADDEVKVRGHRVSLRAVEAAILSCAEVSEAAVIATRDALGDAQLTAFVSGLEGPGDAVVRDHLRERVPAHMRPPRIRVLPALPLTRTGKVDREALRAGLLRDTGEERASPGAASASAGVVCDAAAIAALMADVLERPAVDVDADFFALGGDSLAGAELCARVQLRSGRRLLVSDLAAAPTPARLARLVSLPAADDASLLVPLVTEGAGRPLFLVHTLEGEVGSLLPLARHLSPVRPVYALRARGLGGSAAPHRTIDEMAAAYVREIRQAAPAGPYLLGGRCIGGPIALEMARRLQALGERVALVALVDSHRVPARSRRAAILRAADMFRERRHRVPLLALLELLGLPPEGAARRLPAQAVESLARLASRAGGERLAPLVSRLRVLAATLRGELPTGDGVPRSLRRAMLLHIQRGRAPACVALLLPRDRGRQTPHGALVARWRAYAGAGLRPSIVAGNHRTMAHEPFVRELAARLSAAIAQAEAAERRAPPALAAQVQSPSACVFRCDPRPGAS